MSSRKVDHKALTKHVTHMGNLIDIWSSSQKLLHNGCVAMPTGLVKSGLAMLPQRSNKNIDLQANAMPQI